MVSKQKKIISAIIGLFTAAFLVHASDDMSPEAIKDRIKPVGQVRISGAVVESAGPRSGADVYNKTCVACHGTGAAGAPKTGDAAAWKSRLDAGLETVIKNAINGKGGMPPKGMCMDCSDDEIKAAVEHMIEGI